MIDYILKTGDAIEYFALFNTKIKEFYSIVEFGTIKSIDSNRILTIFKGNIHNNNIHYGINPLDIVAFKKSENNIMYGVVISIENYTLQLKSSKSFKDAIEFSKQYSELL